MGFDKEGYDRNGLNVNGNRKALITHPSQIKYGLRIKHKATGDRGRIDALGPTRVIYTLDKWQGTDIRTDTSIEKFMELFFLDDDGRGKEYEREASYHGKVRQYLYSNYRDSMIERFRRNFTPTERRYVDKNGFLTVDVSKPDELSLKLRADAEMRNLANTAYFAHVDYSENPDLYIGNHEIPGYVIDWADKRSAYYYHYQVHTIDKKLGINFVRKITIKDAIFTDFQDLYNRNAKSQDGSDSLRASLADERLIEIIERNRASKAIHDIVESIQSKQYEIITQDINKDFLILGCAGSGKTMILLHRIRYLLFNNPNMDPGDMMIISPTDILGRESKELAKILNIERVSQWSTAVFYQNILRSILEANGMFHRINELKLCETNSTIDDAAVNSCLDIIGGKILQKHFYVNATQKRLADEKKKLIDTIGEKKILQANRYYTAALSELQKYSCEDIETIIQYAEKKIEAELSIKENRVFALLLLLENLKKGTSQNETYDAKRTQKIQEHLKRLLEHIDKVPFEFLEPLKVDSKVRFIQAISLLSGEKDADTIYQMIDALRGLTYGEIEHYAYEIDADIRQIKRLSRVGEVLENIKTVVDYPVKKSTLETVSIGRIVDSFKNLLAFVDSVEEECSNANIDPFVLFSAYNDVENEISILKNAHRSNDYVFDMLLNQLGIIRDRKTRKIPVNKQQLQKMLHILLQKFKTTDNGKRFIFLDEFQDYSIEELMDIKHYYKNAVLNLYGDVKQCINENGIDDISKVHKCMRFSKEYELKENYRNASEITAYVNNRFGMDMYRIGLPGSIKETTVIELPKLEQDDRAAIIVADEDTLDSIDLPIATECISYYREAGVIHKNCYNVLTVAQAKGLEFERVVAVNKNMSENQMYVACTRAIRDLSVVSLM